MSFLYFSFSFPLRQTETFYPCLIGKQFNIENVKTQISQETNYYLSEQYFNTSNEMKCKWCKVCASHFLPITLGS